MDESKAITVTKLTKKYKDLTAVNNLTFDVRKSEIFAFVGPNGAGKSTTIGMLVTLVTPSAGKAKVAGFDVKEEKDKVRSSIGIIFQDPSLDVELTAYENLYFHSMLYDMPKDLFKTRVEQMLDLVDLNDRRDKPVKTFSGGMKRRLEIARGLLHHPKVLFLDEPTIGLDPQTRAMIWQYLKNLRDSEGTTIFATTHYLPETENADRVAIIDEGKLVALGTPEKLKKQFNTDNMDQVFIEATGHGIRDEELAGADQAKIDYKTGGGMFRR